MLEVGDGQPPEETIGIHQDHCDPAQQMVTNLRNVDLDGNPPSKIATESEQTKGLAQVRLDEAHVANQIKSWRGEVGGNDTHLRHCRNAWEERHGFEVCCAAVAAIALWT